MSRRFSVLGLAATVALSLAASAANSAVFIGLQQGVGPIVPAVPTASGPGFEIVVGPVGGFEQVTISLFGHPLTVPPPLLIGTVTVANNIGGSAGSLTVYMTSTGNTDAIDPVKFTSDFTAINLTNGWSETVTTYLDPANGVFTTPGPALGDATFVATGHNVDVVNRSTGAAPYSVTAVFTIDAPSSPGTSNSSVGIRAEPVTVPEPASVALIGAALTGFGLIARRRRWSR